jgi:FtsP/CotA-like multicopper oxidase with cupredoxin domain
MISRRKFLCSSAGIVGASIIAPPWRYTEASEEPFILLEPKLGTVPLAGPNNPAVSVWGYNGRVPGPVIRVQRGTKVRVRLQNGLEQPTTIHWHGIRINNAMDGVPGLTQKAVPPGGKFDYSFTSPDAGTYWYHSHAKTWEQVARGLYGLLIVEEEKKPLVDQDIIFAADDWRLNASGQIDEGSFGSMHDWSHGGRMGNWLTINGLTNPSIPVRAGERLRLRLINTSNARILAFNFDRLKVKIIALDGQPVPPASPGAEGIGLAPAQRADVIIDMEGKPGDTIPIWETSTGDRLKSAEFFISDKPARQNHDPDLPVILPPNSLNTKLDLNQAQPIELIMEGGAMGGLREARIDDKLISIQEMVKGRMVWAFNGKTGIQKKPLTAISIGQTAIINLINSTAFSHAMHLHGHHFQVIERNGKLVTGSPWRDTELVKRNEQLRIAFVADNPGKWLLHCHMLEHAAAGMVAWVNVA